MSESGTSEHKHTQINEGQSIITYQLTTQPGSRGEKHTPLWGVWINEREKKTGGLFGMLVMNMLEGVNTMGGGREGDGGGVVVVVTAWCDGCDASMFAHDFLSALKLS